MDEITRRVRIMVFRQAQVMYEARMLHRFRRSPLYRRLEPLARMVLCVRVTQIAAVNYHR